ncbi:protein-tyrosine phosphatase [Alteribacillus iranensis]|uniref:Protein-tyrosine phosphatase n=2 Tax=Alteribacillus iranensis TaxID=930128 RepID=A0A1I2BZJ7_9BACI|nr:protein-tyrosine phosphatase [Alteribacillus iranensis]
MRRKDVAAIKHILFVCTGNTCRSPLAEALLRSKATDGVEVKSAGVYAMPDMPASDGTMDVLKEKGIELDHKSQPVTKELVDWADLVLTMTKSHHETTVQLYPEAADKIFTIKEFAADITGPEGDITDPIGGSAEMYRKTAEELEPLIDAVLEKIKHV